VSEKERSHRDETILDESQLKWKLTGISGSLLCHIHLQYHTAHSYQIYTFWANVWLPSHFAHSPNKATETNVFLRWLRTGIM